MRTSRVLLILLLTALVEPLSAVAQSKCCIGGENTFIINGEPFELGPVSGRMPEIIYDEKNRASGIRWIPHREDISVDVEQVGDFRGKEIYRLTYRRKMSDSSNSADRRHALISMVFAYPSAETGKNFSYQPFFYTEGGDFTESVEARFASSKEQPFSLFIQRNEEGSGHFWSSYTFVFNPKEVRLVERSEGGRHLDTETYRYISNGKVIYEKTENAK